MKQWISLFAVATLFSCGTSREEQVYYQKPKGFARIDLPEHRYRPLQGNYPYTFEYAETAEVMPDPSADAEPYWILVKYPALNAMIQFTYKPLNGDLRKLDEHVMDAYKLASKHQIRALSQKEDILTLKNGRKAVTIEIEGEVPSHFQFYTTDTSRHYLRGAVYLGSATLNDSLRPVVDYLKTDARHILETLTWK
ncbi:MAG: gliding motility lipoprotein GldD [Leadbetterella sp.]|nr:gliding motility lipoprotein GldD [Leadbetterella sp.]